MIEIICIGGWLGDGDGETSVEGGHLEGGTNHCNGPSFFPAGGLPEAHGDSSFPGFPQFWKNLPFEGLTKPTHYCLFGDPQWDESIALKTVGALLRAS